MLLLALATALAYANALRGPFVFDDVISIVYNPNLRSLEPFSQIFGRQTELDITPWGRPLVTISLALNYAWGGLEVIGYRLFNISLHFANGLLLGALATHLLRRQTWSLACARDAAPLGFVIALLWLLHPLGTSTATYIVQRAESMMAFFYLATLYGGARFWAAPTQRRWAYLSVLTCWLGMLAKESMITAPVAVLFLGWIFYRATFWSTLRQQWGWLLGLLGSWLLLTWVMTTWPRHASVGFGVRGMNGVEYLLIQIQVILHYFRLTFWPVDLSLNYPQRFWPIDQIPPGTWPLVRSWVEVIPSALGLSALLAGTVWLLWRKPGLGFLLGLVFLILSPTSSFIPITTSLAADHRMYLPAAALVSLVVVLVYLLTEGGDKSELKLVRHLRLTLVVLLSLMLGGLTHARNHDYRDGFTVWLKTLRQHPRDAAGWNELGGVYWMRNEMVLADRAFQAGSEISPTYLLPISNLAVSRWNLGRREEAVTLLQAIINREPNNLNALQNLGLYLDQLGRREPALNVYRKILEINPQNPVAKSAEARLRSLPEKRTSPP